MSKWDKLITRICNLSKDLRFDELRKVLESCGYEMNAPRSGSSHYTFRKQGCAPITIPKHEPIDLFGYHYGSMNQALLAYENGEITLHQNIYVYRKATMADGTEVSGFIKTTLGLLIFNEIDPPAVPQSVCPCLDFGRQRICIRCGKSGSSCLHDRGSRRLCRMHSRCICVFQRQ